MGYGGMRYEEWGMRYEVWRYEEWGMGNKKVGAFGSDFFIGDMASLT